MPVVPIPFEKGLITEDGEADWIDSLPVNMLAVPKTVLDNQRGYMQSWPGLVQTIDVPGLSRGGVNNVVRDQVFRVTGTKLIDDTGTTLANVGGQGLAAMPFSRNTQAVVSNGELFFWDGNALTRLQNWADGERVTTTQVRYTPEFTNNSYIKIPEFDPDGSLRLAATVELTDNQEKQWIFGSTDSGTDEAGIFVESGRFMVQASSSDTSVDIGEAVIGENMLDYATTTLTFDPGITIIGAQLINDDEVNEAVADGTRIFSIVMNDEDAPENSRSYSATSDQPEDSDPPTRRYILDSLTTPDVIAEPDRIEIIGGSPGSPALSTEVLAANMLTVGDFYSVSATVTTSGENDSGWSTRNGILATARIDGEGTQFDVFEATSATETLVLFTENTQAAFTNVRVSGVSHGILVDFPDDDEDIWTIQDPELSVTDFPETDFPIGNIIDAARNRGRYVWIQANSGLFGVTDIQNEQRPDYIAPFYSAEAEPDVNIAIDAWRGYVVVFGRFTIEYFALTGNTEVIYANQQSLTVRAGIVGLGAKTHYFDQFAIVGGPSLEPVSVFMIGQGQYEEVATRRIQRLLRTYTEAELATVFMEPVKFDAHDMLVIHLPRHVLCYDHAASDQQNRRWTILKSDINGDNPYRGTHHIHARGQWSVGDKQANIISSLSFTDARHVGNPVEYILTTPLIQARNVRLFDLDIDSVSGRELRVNRIAYSVTWDGLTYAQENWIDFSAPQDYTTRVLSRRLGYSRNNVGFKLRWISDTPTSISNLRVRFE